MEKGACTRKNIEALSPQKRTVYAATSADFITMPLEPLELRFAVSSDEVTSLTIADLMLTRSSSECPN